MRLLLDDSTQGALLHDANESWLLDTVPVHIRLPVVDASAVYAPSLSPHLTPPLVSDSETFEPSLTPTLSLQIIEDGETFEPVLSPIVSMPLVEDGEAFELEANADLSPPLIDEGDVYEPTTAAGCSHATVDQGAVYGPTLTPIVALLLIDEGVVYAPTLGAVVGPTLILPLIDEGAIYAPTLTPSASLPIIEAGAVYGPSLSPSVVLPLVAGGVLYAPSANVLVAIPIIADGEVFEPRLYADAVSLTSDMVAYLRTKPAITNKVGAGTASRIYPDRPPLNPVYPLILYGIPDGSSLEDLHGAIGMGQVSLRFDCYAQTTQTSQGKKTAEEIREAVKLALQGYAPRELMGETLIHGISVEPGLSWVTDQELDADGSKHPVHRASITFNVFYSEATE
ncbi:MAG TPA: DUF3168 domain-containing protein [Pirellulaceae bacterium]|jgi:hypothetical protein|nr:DUF3168 domain-containing protein [Pirellulaceae bacterium]